MELKDFYRQQFIRLSQEFEPDWEERSLHQRGYRWLKHNTKREETFQIIALDTEPLYFMYNIRLSTDYIQTNIVQVVNQFDSYYELSVHTFHDKILLCAIITDERLDQSILSFTAMARGEMIDILDSLIDQEGG